MFEHRVVRDFRHTRPDAAVVERDDLAGIP
jgi:hypothetical protein